MQNVLWFTLNHTTLFTLWIINLILLIFFIIKEKFSKIVIINYNQAAYKINKENAIVLDIRTPNEYNNGHISNSLNILIKDIKNNNFEKLEKYRNNNYPIILVCTNGESTQTLNLAKILYKSGFNNITILKSGISGWCKENLPIVVKKLNKNTLVK